ncbi:hypothetical protein GCM10022226_76370 [Sphaerisporangium flaviroseum]|uniref:DUF4367 domain-containing protein n=1 Tax=Sphaerisporangium flaviroseum TaxID=509199 RepID=A0ABP7JEI8_9ACTN
MNSPDDLEAELRALGEALETPAPPPAAVAASVRARLERPQTVPEPAARRPEPAARQRRRWVATGIAALLAALLGFTPQGQAAVAQVLRFAGIEIHVGEPEPVPSGVPSPLPGEKHVALDQARETVKFPFLVPAKLGEPDDVRVSDGGRVVSLFWPGVRLDAYDGLLDVVWRKDLGEPWPENVQIGSSPGWWVSGPHSLTYLPSGGGTSESLQRRAESTLIWQREGVGYRLEGPTDVLRAREIAESLR